MPIPLKRATTFCDGLDHPECMAVHPDGTVYAGGEAGQIYKISPDGSTIKEIANTGGFILGVAISPDCNWLGVCDLKKHCVWRVDLKSHRLEVFSHGADKAPKFSIPNHLVFQPDGTLYVTESGGFRENNGCIHVFDTVHGTSRLFHPGPFNFSNGIAIHPDRSSIYVVCSFLPGVERVEINKDGSAGKRSVFMRMPKTVPDGLAFDAKGLLYVSCYAPSRIYRITPDRKLETWFDDWEAHTISNPTNIAFGGPKLDQLYVANLGRWNLTKIDAKVKGAPLACHR